MAVRSTMVDLIARVRLLIGDPAGTTQQFSDQQVQDACDASRLDVRYELLEPRVSFSPTAYRYLDYYSQHGYWEADVVLLGPGYASITALSSELLNDTAHWTFTAGGGNGQYPPVWAAGKSFDPYGASVELLTYWGAVSTGDFPFSADGASFHPEVASQGRLKLADLYRRRMRPRTIKMVRSDVAPGTEDERRARLGPVSSGVPFITGD